MHILMTRKETLTKEHHMEVSKLKVEGTVADYSTEEAKDKTRIIKFLFGESITTVSEPFRCQFPNKRKSKLPNLLSVGTFPFLHHPEIYVMQDAARRAAG